MFPRRLMRSLANLLLLLPLLVACDGAAPDATVVVALGSQLTADKADFVEVAAIQGETTTTAVADSDGSVRLRVVSGVEVRLVATAFFIDDSAWAAFVGTHIFEPNPGPNIVDLEMQSTPTAVGSVRPVFFEETGTEIVAHAWTGPAALRVRDVATGFEVDDVFTTLQQLSLPENRAFVLGVVRPDTGERIELTIDSSTPFGDDMILELGAAPPKPTAADTSVNGDTVDLSSVQFDQAFTVECASGSSCDDPSLAWEACDTDVTLPHSAVEQPVEVFVRYGDIEELCGSVTVTRDLTPPTATLAITPNHLAATDNTDLVVIEVVPSEKIEPTSITVVGAGGTYGCASGIQEGRLLAAGFSTWICTLDVSAWTSGSIELTVTGTDLAGNGFEIHGLIPDASAAASSIVAVGAHPFPAAPDLSFGIPFLLGIDVVNMSTSAACNFGLATQPTISDADTGTAVSELVPTTPGGAYLGLLEGDGGQGTLWIEVNPKPGAVAGNYLLDVEVSATDCVDRSNPAPVTVTTLGPQLPFTVQPHPFRFTGSEPLQLGRHTGISPFSPGLDIDAIVGLATSCATGITIATDNPDVATTDFGECPELFVEGVGSTLLFAQDPRGTEAAVQIDVNPAPTLLVLQSDVVTKMAQDDLETFAVDAGVGTPLRLLWESTADAIVVAGDAGVQLSSALADSVVPLPCSAETILDAALVARGAGQPNAAVALLIKRADSSLHHCEIALDGSVLGSSSLAPVLGSCTAPTRIVSHPVSGSFTLAGDGCVATYSATGGSLAPISSAASTSFVGAPKQVAYDPFGNYLAVTTSSRLSAAGGWGLGPVTKESEPFDIDPYLGSVTWADAVTIDPVSGEPIIASSVFIDSQIAYVMRFANRFVIEPPTSVSVTGGTGFRWTQMALDAAHRILYAADTGDPPAVWSIDIDSSSTLRLIGRGVRYLPSTSPVVDLVVAGPQPIAAEPRAAQPGGVVTVSGTGFAGDGQDEVFILGVRAETLASSPTHVVFRVPLDLVSLQRDLPQALLTVRSHGRMSGPVAGGFGLELLWPSRFYRSVSPSASACTQPGLCTEPLLLEANDRLFAARPSTGVDAGIFDVDSATLTHTTPASHAVLLPGSRRLLGHAGGAISDYTLLEGPLGFEETRVVRTAVPATTGAMAVDAAGHELFLLEAGFLKRLWATTLEPSKAPSLPAPTISGIESLTTMPDGSAVVAANQSGEIEVFRLDTGEAQAIGPDPNCPAVTRLAGLWPRFQDVPELYVALADTGGNLLASAVLRDDAGTFSLKCTSSVATHAASHVGLSPVGDTLVVIEAAWMDASYSIRLLDPDDLTREMDYYADVGITPAQGVLVGNGPSWSDSQRVAIPDLGSVEAGTIHATRSYSR